MRRSSRGFTLIDVVVSIAFMLLLFLALFGVLRASLVLSALAKAKAAAVEIANTQMEYLQGISYDAIGTVGGIPTGLIPQTATTTVDGVRYVTRTYIEYKDDAADGLGAADTNHVTTDYKVGKVTVSYSLSGLSKSVTVVSDFSPPGIESTTGGGTISIRVADASGTNMSGASVQIVNASTTPSINFTTVSDTTGLAIVGGAATSSQYQIFVTRLGYSSAQTYARTATNVNPTPGYLTVVKDQTTSSTFQIDLLSSLVLSSFSPATTIAFTDTFSNASNIANQTNTQVTGGAITLDGEEFSGTALSIPIAPSYLDGWGILSATLSQPSGTTAVVHVADASGTLLPDSALAGNSSGFSSFPVSLTDIATSSYPGLVLEAELTRNATTTNSSVLDWSISHTEGPTPLPNISFTLTGAKTIGTNGSGQSIYKTTLSDTTGAGGSKTESMEWDSYKLTAVSNIIESCPAAPYSLSPGQTSPTSLIIGALTTNTLPLVIVNSASSTLSGAKVILTKSGYAATVPTSACGLAFFSGLASGTYSATVSAAGHATKVFSTVNVSGHTATTTLVLP